MSKVHEFGVRIVEPGRDEVFARRLAAFIAKLKTQKGVLADREFESFFALPTPDEQPVFIGMTTYDALATVNRVQMNPLVMLKFLPSFMTMQLKAYCFAEQTDGPELDLDALAKSPGKSFTSQQSPSWRETSARPASRTSWRGDRGQRDQSQPVSGQLNTAPRFQVLAPWLWM